MRNLVLAVGAAGLLAGCTAVEPTANGQALQASADSSAKVYRDLSGVWQVLNTANDNVEAHDAQHAYQLRDGPFGPVPAKNVLAMGAVGAVPPGPSVIKGRQTLPYLPGARKRQPKTSPTGRTGIPKRSVICRVCRVPHICRTPSRSSRMMSRC